MNFIPENEHIPDGYVPEVQLENTAAPEVPEAPEHTPDLSPNELLPELLPEDAPEDVPDNMPEDASVPQMDAVLDALHTPKAPEEYFPHKQETAPPKKENFLKTAWQERRIFLVLTSLFVLLAIICVSVIGYVYFIINPYQDYRYILPNVYCAGVDLGGMTRKEAQEAIEEALRNPSYSVTVNLPDCSYTFCPQQEGVTLNGAIIAEKAYKYMREDTSAYGMYKAYHAAKRTEYQLDAETDLIFSVEDIQETVDTIYQETYIEATDSSISNDPEAHTVSIALGTPGRQVDKDALTAAVTTAFEDMDFKDITIDYEPVEIDLVALWELTQQAEKDFSFLPVDPVYNANVETHSIELTMGTPGYSVTANDLYTLAKENVNNGTYGTVTLDMTELLPVDVDITPTYYELACDPIEPYYAYGGVVEGSSGYSLDWESAVNTIVEAAWGQSLSIPMTEVKPQRTASDIKAVLFRDQLSSFSSPHTAESGRTTNLKLACKAINGTVINPGEVFSFNNVVGQRTAAKGYQEAIAYVGSESVKELGGGICQVASTIYDAALYADMDIVERDNHTYFVTYVKGGLDATVYWGAVDFRFRNNTDYPIRINASVSGGYVHISIDGTKTNDNYVVLSSTKLSSTPYTTVTKYDDTKPSTYSEVTTTPYTGYVYEAYQYVYSGNGTLLESNYLGKSTYQKRDQVITKGTKTTSSGSSTTPSPSTSPEATTPDTTTPETTTED